jgi:hypothetical protein
LDTIDADLQLVSKPCLSREALVLLPGITQQGDIDQLCVRRDISPLKDDIRNDGKAVSESLILHAGECPGVRAPGHSAILQLQTIVMNCFADVSKLDGSFETPKTWAKFGSIEPPAGRIKKDPFCCLASQQLVSRLY